MYKVIFTMIGAFFLPGLACVFFGYAAKWMNEIRDNKVLLSVIGFIAFVSLWSLLKKVARGLREMF